MWRRVLGVDTICLDNLIQLLDALLGEFDLPLVAPVDWSILSVGMSSRPNEPSLRLEFEGTFLPALTLALDLLFSLLQPCLVLLDTNLPLIVCDGGLLVHRSDLLLRG